MPCDTMSKIIRWKDRLMRVEIILHPAERRTKYYPGCAASFEVGKVTDCETGREMSSRWWDEHEQEIHDIIEEG